MRRRLVSSLLCCALASSVVHATAPARADEPTAEKQALELFEQSKVAYREGRFQDAIELLKKAHAIHPEPVLLYNLARAFEGNGDFEPAIAAYEQYLHDASEIPDRPAIEKRVAGLRRSVDEKARLARERDEARRAQKPGPAAPAERRPSLVPWIVLGVGGAGGIAGGVLGILALRQHDDAESSSSQLDAIRAQGRAEDLGVASTVAFVAGGALAGVGLTWGIIDLSSSGPGAKPKQGSTRVRLVAGGSFVGVRGELP